jgi:hypothetical protein
MSLLVARVRDYFDANKDDDTDDNTRAAAPPAPAKLHSHRCYALDYLNGGDVSEY